MAMITCPECGRRISDRAHACPHCGLPKEDIIELLREMRTEGSEEADAKAGTPWDNVPLHMPGMIRCAVCGSEYNSADVFHCPECGYPKLHLTREYHSVDALVLYEKLFVQIMELASANTGHLGAEEYMKSLYSQSMDERWYKVGLEWKKYNRPEKAIECFTVAAEQGHSESMCKLGNESLEKGETAEAIKWLTLAAEKGSKFAPGTLAYMYNTGDYGAPRDEEEAIKWYKVCAKNGNVSAQTNLGKLYSFKEMFDEAIKWFTAAAENGDIPAMFHLGELFQIKNINVDESVRWYTQAALQGDEIAAVRLGGIYNDGELIPRDKESAKKWYMLAANRGNKYGQYNLGKVYEEEGDVSEAINMFRLAAKQGYSLAEASLGTLGYAEDAENNLISYKGLYRNVVFSGLSEYLRFFPDGTVVGVSSTGEPYQVIKWLGHNYENKGKYELSGNNIAFQLVSPQGTVVYKGTIIDNKTLHLDYHSLINNHWSRNKEYSFCSVSE